MVADLVVGFEAFKETFTCRVDEATAGPHRVDYVEGPLKYLHNEWKFDPRRDGGTEVDFGSISLSGRGFSRALAGQMFDRALRRMIGAFESARAALYGISSSSAQSAA